jgi:hypothetical protein
LKNKKDGDFFTVFFIGVNFHHPKRERALQRAG